MFVDRSTLYASLQGLVGAYQTINPAYPNLASSLLTSRSGKYWNDEHGLLNIENIVHSQRNFSHFNYTPYNGGTTYSQYDKVQSGGINYEYINATPSSGNAPPNATYWSQIDNMSDYLLQIDYKASDMVIDGVMNMKKLKGQTKSIFENVLLYRGRDEYTNTETNSGKLVGLRLTLKDHRSLITILHKIGHQFNEAVGPVTFYLFHTSQQAALTTFSVTHATAKTSQWTSLSNYTLRFLSDNHDIGGDFYLCYFQDDLGTAKAIKKDIRWDLYNPVYDMKEDYKRYSNFVDVVGFSFASTDLNGTSLPDPENIVLDYHNNYGLNLQFTSKCDLTPFITQQEDLLSEAKSLSMAYLLLRDMAFNTRATDNLANKVREQAKKELYTFPEAWGTVQDRLQKALKGLDFDLSGMHDACLPCNDAITVNYTTV